MKLKQWILNKKIVNFPYDTATFFRGFSCLTEVELILEVCGKASSSKINFLKSQVLWGVAYKNRIDNQDKWPGHNISSK